MRLLDPRNGEAHDLPPPTGPVRTYAVASVPRTGSTLLCRLLWETGRVGAPKEYLNPMQLRDWEVRLGHPLSRRLHQRASGLVMGAVVGRGWTAGRLRAHLERVQQRRSSGGWFGLKVHQHHHHRLLATGVSPAVWIRIRRRDRLGQAISWARALQTDQWAHWQQPSRSAVYRRSAVRQRIEAIEAAERAWDGYLALQPRVVEVEYSQLVAAPAEELRRVFAALEAPAPSRWPDPPTVRQANADSVRWRTLWLAGA